MPLTNRRTLLYALALCPAAAAHADQAREIWATSQQRTLARVNLENGDVTTFGTGIVDPFYGDVGDNWSTLAVTPQRTIYMLRRRVPNEVHVYSIGADDIKVENGNIVNMTVAATLGLTGNLDGLTSGPDGNLYISSYESAGGPFANGLYRFNTQTKAVEFVGHFPGGTGQPNSFYTDLAFDPVSGDLIGSGFGPGGNLTLYRLDGDEVLSGHDMLFDWKSFGPAWDGVNLTQPQTADGIAFDPLTGELFLSGDGGPIGQYDRETAAQIRLLDNIGGLGWDLDYQVIPAPGAAALAVMAMFAGGRRRR